MALVFTAYQSEVKINDETLEGLQSIEYQESKDRQDVGAIGTDERIAVYFGMKQVMGKLRLASANVTLDKLLAANTKFSVTVAHREGDTIKRSVTFDDCYAEDKAFSLAAEGHGETVYTFTATRVREE
jgi:fibronectin type 3 domain-containing protein